MHLAALGIPFTPLEPPELRERCLVLAERLRQAAQPHQAADRQPEQEPRP
jgi:hypothetical protein